MTPARLRLLTPFIAMAACLLAPRAILADQLSTQSDPDLTFTILHTNDLHAHDMSFAEKGRVVGGMPRIATLIKTVRDNTKNVVVVDAGDIFQGTPFFKLYHGQVEVDMLNAAGYDIYTIGNHEFDAGSKNLAERLKTAKFDIISANLDASAVPELQRLIKSSVVRTIDGKKVGFVGGITPYLSEVALDLQGVKVKAIGDKWMQPFREEVQRLKSEGVDKIVLVTHCGLELEKPLAEALPDVDVIVGGHSHSRLDEPVIIKRADGSTCALVQAWCYGRMLGKLTVSFDKQGRLILPKLQYQLIPVTDKLPENAAMKAELIEKQKPFLAQERTICGIANAPFPNHFRQIWTDSALGNLIADSLVDAGKEYGATIGLQNRGGIRAGMDCGPISQAKIEEMLPFDNRLVLATVKGSLLIRALEHSLSGDFAGGRFLDVSGLRIIYDRDLPPDHRILSLKTLVRGKWEDVRPDQTYKIAINDFSFKGGEGYDFTAATNVVKTEKRLSTFFMAYLLKNKKLTPTVAGGRILPRPHRSSSQSRRTH